MSSNLRVIKGGKKDVDEEARERRREGMLEVLDEMKARVEAGDMTEFVAASIDSVGEVNIHIFALDIPGAVGLFEIGKNTLLNSYDEE